MTTQAKRANDFKNLHIKGSPLILVNIWDGGSAQALQATGAKAIGTSNWSVVVAHGYEDGEDLDWFSAYVLPFETPAQKILSHLQVCC